MYLLSYYYVLAISKQHRAYLKHKHMIFHAWVYCLGNHRSRQMELSFRVAQIIHNSALILSVQSNPRPTLGTSQFPLSYPVGPSRILQEAHSVGTVLPGLPAHHAQLHLIILAEEVDFLPVLGADVLLFYVQPGHQLETLNVLHHAGQLPIGPEAPWAKRLLAEWAGWGLLGVRAGDLKVAGEADAAEVVATVNGDRLPEGPLADGAVDLICQAGHRGSRSHSAAALVASSRSPSLLSLGRRAGRTMRTHTSHSHTYMCTWPDTGASYIPSDTLMVTHTYVCAQSKVPTCISGSQGSAVPLPKEQTHTLQQQRQRNSRGGAEEAVTAFQR